MPATDPDLLDQAAAALYDTAAWQSMVDGWHLTAEPARPANSSPSRDGADLVSAVPGLLLTKTVAELTAEALRSLPPAAPAEHFPGRIAALIPGPLHTWRRLYQPDLKPSVQLGYAARVLQEWGWQNQPYRLRSFGGARCICGAIIAAQRLGYGTRSVSDRSATFVLGELRHRGWTELIGPWNSAPGRTAQQATDLLTSASRTAAQAGY